MEEATPIEFKLVRQEGGRALYAVTGENPGAYFLLAAAAPDPVPTELDLEGSWKYPGAYLLSEAPPAGKLADLAALVRMVEPPAQERALAWLGGEGDGLILRLPVTWSNPQGGSLASRSMVVFGELELLLPPGNRVALGAGGFTIAPEGVQFIRERTAAYPLPPEQEADLVLPLSGPAVGRISFGAAWSAFNLFAQFRDEYFESAESARGGEVRFFAPGKQGTTTQMVYPLFAAVPAVGAGNPVLHLDVELDPRFPFCAERTRMLFRPGSEPALRSEFGLGPAGAKVSLTPLVDESVRTGFSFGRRPGSGGEPGVYLAPVGPFELSFESGQGRMMCGLSALEYLEARSGDRLVFAPDHPAFAGPDSATAGEAVLDHTYTTPWVEYVPGDGADEADATPRAYYGQPDASTNYGRDIFGAGEGEAMNFSAAVASRVTDLPTGSGIPFPLGLYGGAMLPLAGAEPDAEALTEFEAGRLAAERGRLLRTVRPAARAAGLGEPAAPNDPVFADAAGNPIKGGTTSTPQGFVVALNSGTESAGTWAQVDLARDEKARTWSLAATAKDAPVDPWLASTLTKDQLFLVLSDWTKAPGMSGLLSVGGFDFEVVPPTGAESSRTVLVLKYSTARSLTELIEEEGSWELNDHFVGDDEQVKATKAILIEALKVAEQAKGETGDPFGYFRETVASKATWTGVLAFNCLVPGNKMPADLQMLYAGIEGQLRAHHFGVELNRIERDGTSASIRESSLFGVIHYSREPAVEPDPPPPPAHDFEFTLRELNVAIRNSAVNDFHSRVLVRANRLFGREVTLAPATQPANTITLSGQYQRHGDVGTVTFTAPSSGTFGFGAAPYVRVLAGMSVSAATLTPVSSTEKKGPHGQETQIVAQVTLAGDLMFNPAPFEELPELDLFSYGPEAGKPLPSEGGGIPLSGFGLTVECALYGKGEKTPTTVRPDLSAVLVADNHEALRPEGLVAKLPLTLKSFLAAEAEPGGGGEEAKGGALDTAKLGALPVNVVPLAGPGGRVTSQPTYALQFSLPMGSLGGLADAHASLEATLILGWGPSTFSTDDDGIGVFVALPFVSAGAFGFELQGLLKTTFGDANLARVTPPGGEPTYVVLFNNIALSLLGLRFPPRVITDFILFAGPETKGRGNLGWSLAATMPASGPAALERGTEVISR